MSLGETKVNHMNEIDFDRPSSDFPWRLLSRRDKQDTVFLMVLSYGQQSLTMIKEHLKYFERTDLKNKLPPSSPGPKKEPSVEKHHAALSKQR
uniref:Uncharacterized protein n=1 Tax=Gasterosteus aculeatus TaxID=69293 RepID=G3PFE9_GASAC